MRIWQFLLVCAISLGSASFAKAEAPKKTLLTVESAKAQKVQKKQPKVVTAEELKASCLKIKRAFWNGKTSRCELKQSNQLVPWIVLGSVGVVGVIAAVTAAAVIASERSTSPVQVVGAGIWR